MNKIIHFMLLIIATITIGGCQSAERSTNNGVKALAKKQYSEALQCFDDAIKIDNKYVKAYISRGVTLAETNNIDKAINDFIMAAKLDPTIPVTYLSLGLAYANKNNYKQAINEFTKAIELNKAYGDAYYNRGIAYTKIGDMPSALSDVTHAISCNPDNDQYLFVRGNIHYELEDLLLAMKDYISALKLNPKVSKYYSKMGLCLYGAELYSFALLYCKTAITLDPRNEEANEIGKASIHNLAYEKNLSDIYDEAVVMYLKQQKQGQNIDRSISSGSMSSSFSDVTNEPVVTNANNKKIEQSHKKPMTRVTLQRPSTVIRNIIVSKDTYFNDNKASDVISTISAAEYDVNNDGKADILYSYRGNSGTCGRSWDVILTNAKSTYSKSRSYAVCTGDELYFTGEMNSGLKVPYYENSKLRYNANKGFFEQI